MWSTITTKSHAVVVFKVPN